MPGWPAPAKLLVRAAPFAEEVRSVGNPASSYLASNLELWVAEYGGPIDPSGEKIHRDIACVAAVADPGSVKVERHTLPTQSDGRGNRGMMEALERLPEGPRP